MRKLVPVVSLAFLALGCLDAGFASGQAAIKYQKPPQGIETLLDAPATPLASVSPDRKTMALSQPISR